MNHEEMRALMGVYKRNPEYFTENDTDALAQHAQGVGVSMPKTVEDDDFNMLRVVQQAADGVIKGGIGFIDPEWGGKPRNTAEEIAKSVGELGGFVGAFFLPVGEALNLVGHAAGWMRMGRTAEIAINSAAHWSQNVTSVPLAVGNWAVEKVGVESAARAASGLSKVIGMGGFIGEEAALGIGKQMV